MPLSLDDEVFVEKCFQRSLLVHIYTPPVMFPYDFQELDKLISFSGTPTVVWRRTGEICLVAPEFCVLTGWSKEELVGQKKYIYEVNLSSTFTYLRPLNRRSYLKISLWSSTGRTLLPMLLKTQHNLCIHTASCSNLLELRYLPRSVFQYGGIYSIFPVWL